MNRTFFRHGLAPLVLFIAMLALVEEASCQSIHTTAQPFSSEVESLLRTELDADEDSVQVARVQKLFSDYKIPKTLDLEVSVDWVVLLAQDQPLTFLRTVAPAVSAAVREGWLPATSELFFQAAIRRNEAKAKLGEPTAPRLRTEIETLLVQDQAVRKSEGFDPKKMGQQDDADRARVQAILERYGVPTAAMVGSQAASDFVVLIQHQPPDFRREALPKLKANVDSGQASPRDYAMMYDRAQTDEGKPEMYGVNLICQPDGSLSPGLLVDPAHVEDRRAAIGLMPLATYLRMAALLAPPDFCKKMSVPSTN